MRGGYDARVPSFDLIVIGGGINGAAIARDAAMRGLAVVLLDKDDLGSGTTAWSTRLVHGGLRYLERLNIPLVRESLHERGVLMSIAPHLVHPMSFMIPIYRSGKRGPGIIRLGMVAYDVLSLDKSMGKHRMLSPENALREEPGLNPEGLQKAAVYYDAQAEFPERLSLEYAMSARMNGAVVRPYTRAERILINGNRVTGVEVTDRLSHTTEVIRAGLVVNAAGPWVDQVLESLPLKQPRLLSGTKGSHIVVDPFPRSPAHAVYLEAEDFRPYFIVPWRGKYLIGTTDIPHEGDPGEARAGEREIAYLIDSTNKAMPGAYLQRKDVLYCYAGVRPLAAGRRSDPGGISRRHILHDHAPDLEGLVSVAGGKITTSRRLGKEMVDLVFKKLRRKDPGCATAKEKLPGAHAPDFSRFCMLFRKSSSLPEDIAQRLLGIYGSRAVSLLDYAAADPELGETLGESIALKAEIPFAVRTEMARRLSDVLLRRAMLTPDASPGPALEKEVEGLAEAHLGWDRAKVREELDHYHEQLDYYRPEEGG